MGRRFNIVTERTPRHERVLHQFDGNGRFVQTVHWEIEHDDEPVVTEEVVIAPVIPELVSAETSSNISILLSFNPILNTDFNPDQSSFDVKINNVSIGQDYNDGSGVTNDGNVLLNYYGISFAYGDTITISYTQPALNPLQGLTGGKVASFSSDVTNNVALVLDAPTALSATVISDTAIDLNCTATEALSYEISTNGTDYTEVGTVAKGTTILHVTGLTAGTLYYFRVRAYLGVVYSEYSGVVSATTFETETMSQKTRIEADGGTVIDLNWINSAIYTLKTLGIYTSCKLLSDANFAVKKDVNNLVLKHYDISGNDNDAVQATGVSQPLFDADGGYLSKADIILDGSNDFLSAPNSASLTLGISDFTIIARFKKGVNGTYGGIISKIQSDDFKGWSLNTQADNKIYFYFNSNDPITSIASDAITDTNWHTAKAERSNGNYLNLYIEKNKYSIAAASKNINDTIPLVYGVFRSGDTAHNLFNGSEGLVVIFNTLLNVLQSSLLYNLGIFETGVWKSQGTILSGTGNDEAQNLCEPFVFYEGNAQILETEGNVFKIWYSENWNGDLSYAESLTGLPGSWTKYASNPIIADSRCPDMIKVGNEYWLYRAKQDNTAFDLYISANGVTGWVLDTANVLLPGTSGDWDDEMIANKDIIIDNGVWYMFYEARNATTHIWHIGLATSSNGKTWAKQGQLSLTNTTFVRCGPNVKKIGSSFYMWCHGADVTNDNLPSDIMRYKSSDLTTWTLDINSTALARSAADEGYTTLVGQCADANLIEVNNKVYLFYSASADGNQASGHLHIKLAIADMTLAELVLTQEGNKL
jgi:predicted GH43/DUF377 family glycosyl hydrolase